jgi:hypothetical protein
MWTPAHVWVWEPPTDAQTWRTIDLREFCEPQSMLLRLWHVPISGTVQASFRLVELSAVAGPLFLIWTVVGTIRSHRSEFRPDLPDLERSRHRTGVSGFVEGTRLDSRARDFRD